MNVIEEQLASYEKCYKNRIKMETREKQREQKNNNTNWMTQDKWEY